MQTITSPTTTVAQPAGTVVRSAGPGHARWLAAKLRLRRALVAIVATVGVAAIAGAVVTSQASARPATLKVKGTFDSQTVTGPSCTAPTGECFEGAFHGKLDGPTSGSLLSVTPTQQPDVVLIDASFTIHTRHGDLTFDHEQIVYNASPEVVPWLVELRRTAVPPPRPLSLAAFAVIQSRSKEEPP